MQINIMSCEGRSYLDTTLASLPAEAEVTIFYQYETTPLVHPTHRVVNNPKYPVPVRCNAGWHYAHILEHGAFWDDRILIIEDDVQLCQDFVVRYQKLMRSIPPHAMTALYACYHWGTGRLEAVPYPVNDFYGTQAMVFDRWVAERAAQHLYRNVLRYEQYDLLLKEVCHAHQIPLLASRYSLVQHFGAITTGMSASLHQCENFIDDHSV